MQNIDVGIFMRVQVYEPELQEQLRPMLESIVPLPAPYYPDYIAANQVRAKSTKPTLKFIKMAICL